MISNPDVAALLDEYADLLEIRGSNPFRIRAYRNAVRTIDGLTRPLARMIEQGEDLSELPAIGSDLASHLRTIVETGRFPRLDEIAEEVPRSLAVLVKLDGVGPRKAKKLFEELEITTVDQLEQAIEENQVETLSGFGKKSAAKILRSIEELRSHQGRFQISEVEELIAPLLEHVRAADGVDRLEVAGSFRRRRETVGDVDLLVQAEEGRGDAIVEHFTTFSGAERVQAAGGTRGSIVLRSGLQVDLRVIPRESWGAAQHYFTGSKEHNVRIRQLAQRKGLRVNEWGVYRVPEGEGEGDAAASGEAEAPAPTLDPSWERVGGATEEEVFGAVDLPWIPPELRENRGEIEAAREGELPELITLDDVRGDLQMHSTWSDGKHSIEAMASACRDLGYDYLAITDHSPNLAMVQGLTPEKAREQWAEIDEVRERLDGSVHLFRSCEVDILRDGSLDMPDDILEELDLVLISVHSLMEMDEATMTERVLTAMRHPEVDVLAHPTGRILGRRTPYALDVEAVLQAAKELDVAVELNADPNRLDLNDLHVRRAKELGVKVVISTDAHSTRGLESMRFGIDQARRGWLEPADVLNCLPLDDVRAWLGRREA